jgi:hypothetical protein
MPVDALMLSSLFVIVAMTSGFAQTQNLDQDKSGAMLFAATCKECHRSPRGLAKGRFSLTLSLFLRQHYSSSLASAQTLTAYLQSVDIPGAKSPSAIPKSQLSGAGRAEPALRPPASVPAK